MNKSPVTEKEENAVHGISIELRNLPDYLEVCNFDDSLEDSFDISSVSDFYRTVQ